MRLIDAERLDVIFGNYKEYDRDSYMAGMNAVIDQIDKTPTIRCKDCSAFVPNNISGQGICGYLRGMISEDFGCADWSDKNEAN